MADEEPVDPKRELEDRCKAPCTRPLKEYQVSNYIQHPPSLPILFCGYATKLVLREFKVMNPDTNTVRDNTLITGAVLTIALLPSYLRISNNNYKTSSVALCQLTLVSNVPLLLRSGRLILFKS